MLDSNKVLEKEERLNISILNEIIRSVRNFESVPKRATITTEYVKCGKDICRKCNGGNEYGEEFHGPYFYAIWRDRENNGRLKKKYIGKDDPRSAYLKPLLERIES